jgi:peptidoglycan/LPS O-acetylase OafA/YrhL
MKPGRQLSSLTGMRFFLALWVILYHEIPHEAGRGIAWLPYASAGADNTLRTGYAAVTVFFLLSGFVLAYNYDLDKRWSRVEITRFAAARFSRIYPAYFAGLLLLVPFALYRVIRDVGDESLSFRLFPINAALLQAWLPRTALTWNYPGWSLSDEAFFYLSFPAAGMLLWRIRKPSAILMAGLALWALSLAGPLITILAPVKGFGDVPATVADFIPAAGFWANVIRYNPVVRIPEFWAGILLARLYRSLSPKSHLLGRGYWFYLPGIAVSGLVLAYASAIPYPLVHNGLLLPAYASAIFGLALDGGLLARILSAKPVVLLGNASYAMYILHVPIQIGLIVAMRRVFSYEVASDSIGWVLCYVLVVVVSACFFFKRVEEPLHIWARKKLNAWLERRAFALAPREVPSSTPDA